MTELLVWNGETWVPAHTVKLKQWRGDRWVEVSWDDAMEYIKQMDNETPDREVGS